MRAVKQRIAFYNKMEVDSGLLKTLIEEKTVQYSKKRLYTKPKCIFHIDNNFYHNNDEDALRLKGFATSGSLLMIDGKPKSRKTTFAYMMAAAALNPSGIYQNIVSTMDPNNFIMIFDTEQTPGEFYDKMDLIAKWSQNDSVENTVHSYNLALFGHDPEMKIQAINHYARELDASYRRNGVIDPRDQIGYIIIDHIGDLVNNENDKDEVKDVLGFLSKLSNDTGALIAVIIHQNKNNDQATGMLGGDAAKKVSSHVKTYKKPSGKEDNDEDNDQSNPTEVIFFDNRFGAKKPKRFIFNYDDFDYPVILDHKAIHYNFSV